MASCLNAAGVDNPWRHRYSEQRSVSSTGGFSTQWSEAPGFETMMRGFDFGGYAQILKGGVAAELAQNIAITSQTPIVDVKHAVKTII